VSAPPISFLRVPIAPVSAFGEAFRRIRDQYWLFLGITFVGMILASLAPLGLLMGPMYCGIFACYRDKWLGRTVKFENLFRSLDSFTFLQSFVASLIMMVASFAVIMPFVVLTLALGFVAALSDGHGSDGPSGGHVFLIIAAAVLGTIFLITAMVVIGTLFIFTFPLIMDRRVEGLEAVKLSARAAWANKAGIMGLMGLTILLSVGGMCLLYVGAFLVAPITFGAIMVVYERVFGIADRTA
jgi:uncharacterized membrane protein